MSDDSILDPDYPYTVNHPEPGITITGRKDFTHRHLTMNEGFLWMAERMNRVIQGSPLKVFVADLNSDFWVPWRLTNVASATLGQIDTCGELILDSGIADPTIKNPELINRAEQIGEGVDWVVPKDYSNDTDATIKSVHEFFQMAPDWIKERALIPLQGTCPADYVRCYEELKHYGSYFGFGGIAGKGLTKAPSMQSVQAKKEAVKHLLNKTDIQQLHLFGQTNMNWVDVYHDPRVISCDSNKFGQQAMHKDPPGRGTNSGCLYGWRVAGGFFDFIHAISENHTPQGRTPAQHEFGKFFEG